MQFRRLIILLISFSTAIGISQQENQVFADQWEYMGIAVEEPGYTIWGSSPIETPDGKVHLFVARWPCENKPK